MDDIEKALSDRLKDASESAGPARLDVPRLKRRIRARRGGYFVVAAACVVMLFGVSVSAIETFGTDPGPAPAAAQRPERNTVFVLDYQIARDDIIGGVHVASAEDAGIDEVETIPLGSTPDMAVAPGGGTIFGVAHYDTDTNDPYSMLSVIETRTGAVLDEERVDQWQGTSGAYLSPKIAASTDGRLVYVIVGYEGTQAIQVYDVAAGEMLEDKLDISTCGHTTLLPTGPRQLAAACRSINEILFFDVSGSGEASPPDAVELGLPSGGVATGRYGTEFDSSRLAGAAFSDRTGLIYTVTRAGDTAVVDARRREVVESAHLQLPADSLVSVPLVEVSPDGNRLFVGAADQTQGGSTVAHSIITFNTQNWQRTGSGRVEARHTFAMSPTGNRIYGIDAETGAVSGFDAAANRTLGRLGKIGLTPVAVYTAR